MNFNRDVLSGSDLEMPSGGEVGSAAFHPPVVRAEVVTPQRAGMRSRIERIRSRGVSKLHDVQRNMKQHGAIVKGNVLGRADESVARIRTSMRSSPMKWAGIAAGSGLLLGLLGRVMEARGRTHRHLPQLVIIESSC